MHDTQTQRALAKPSTLSKIRTELYHGNYFRNSKVIDKYHGKKWKHKHWSTYRNQMKVHRILQENRQTTPPK